MEGEAKERKMTADTFLTVLKISFIRGDQLRDEEIRMPKYVYEEVDGGGLGLGNTLKMSMY